MAFARRVLGRYGRNKVIAALVTFGGLWILVKVLFPGGVFRGIVEDLVAPHETPETAFAGRVSGIDLEVVGVVEAVLPDSLPPAGEAATLQRLRFRSRTGHPLTLVRDLSVSPRALAEVGDSVVARGTYLWDTRGGRLLTSAGDPAGWIRLLEAERSDF